MLLNCPRLNIQVELWFSSQFHKEGKQGEEREYWMSSCVMFDLQLGLKPQHPHKPSSVGGKLNMNIYVLVILQSCWSCVIAWQESFEKQLSNGQEEKVEKGDWNRKDGELWMDFGSVIENATESLQKIAEEQ